MLFEKKVLGLYRSIAHNRCDDTGTAYYFSQSDFEGLQAESFAFASSMGHTLQGKLYSYPAEKLFSDSLTDKKPSADRLLVFDHGFGGGHSAYMREIEYLCRHGFRVFAYDHTGCMASGGITPNGMAQSLRDLNDCLLFLKNQPRFAGCRISVMGHSWGGFSTLNICALHPDITHIVAMSGFVSVEKLVESLFGGILRPWKKAIMKLETDSNPDFVGFNAVESLQKTDAKVLLVYSDNDRLCCKKPHFDLLKAGLADKQNVRFLLEKGKSHNPNYTRDAVKKLADYSAKRTKFIKTEPTAEQKKEFVRSFDWYGITEQDPAVWMQILNTLCED